MGDRLPDHHERIRRCAGGDDPQPWGVREVRLRGLGVVLDGTDPAPVGHADHDPHRQRAGRAQVQPGDLGGDLVERGEDEPVELDLGHGRVPAHRQAHGRADDPALGQWRVDDPVLAVPGLQAVGDAEHPTEAADVLAHQQDLRVVAHRRVEPGVEGLGHREHGHVSAPVRSRRSPAR